jgi:peptide/nickel transport system ATP-binding protein
VALLENHWLKTGVTTFDQERGQIANLSELAEEENTNSARLRPGSGSSPEDLRRLLDEARADSPEERIWNGVESIESDGHDLYVTFHPGVDPPLRRSDDVDVACVLY